jgi:hypothetical protein
MWKLCDGAGREVTLPITLKDSQGDAVTVIGGRPPMKPSSTGRIYTEDGREYFPGVVDLRWEDK